MRRAGVVAVWAGALGAATGLATAVVPVAYAVGGEVAPGAVADATVRLEIAGDPEVGPGETRERACSGALVAASWVITAASCFADASGDVPSGAPRWATTATVGRPDLTVTSGQVVKVDRLVPRADRDVVLVHLASKVTAASPVALATTPPVVGETLTVAGYGRTADAIVPDSVHAAAYTVTSVGEDVLDIAPAQDDAAICKGDAGGPALRVTSAGDVELVAIHHTAHQGGCLGSVSSRREATETRLDDLRTWVAQVTAPRPGEDGFTTAYAASLYRDLLGREASAAERARWASLLDSGTSPADVVRGIVHSTEWRRGFVAAQYRTLLGREPDEGGLSTWVSALASGATTFDVERGFVRSAEYYIRAGSTDAGLVQALYRDLLGREASASEVASWTSRIAASGRTAVVDGIASSREHANRVVDQRYRQMLGRAVDAQGLATSIDALNAGGTVQELLVRLAVSGEYRNGRVWAL